MARAIPASTLSKLAQTHGVEPIIIAEITWALGGTPLRYATKDISALSDTLGQVTIPGKIQELGSVDSVVAISLNETSEEFSLVLDDTDGTIKEIIDTNDIMLRDVVLYQWFEGLDFDDRFIIFQGKINSPISWSETDRTVKFSVVSQLEDKDVGFSPEEGTFPDLPDDMVGKVWPECFGTSVHQKAIQVDFKHSGTLGEAVGLHDFTLPFTISALGELQSFFFALGVLQGIVAASFRLAGAPKTVTDPMFAAADAFFQQSISYVQPRIEAETTLTAQLATERSSFRVIGGGNFPRGTLKLEISGAIFIGSFEEDIFRVSQAIHPEAKNFIANPSIIPGANLGGFGKILPFALGTGVEGDTAGPFFAQAGASVTIFSAEPIRHFVSITPGTVLKVAAFATFDANERVLVDVPESLYRVFQQSYGSVTVTVVEVNDALSKQDPPWEDTIYVTYESSVGPNPIDIMTYLIDKYADTPVDEGSFAECRDALSNYPMNFCLNRKKNIVTVLKELSFMVRTAVSIKNGKFFCRYLPAQPDSEFTFSEDTVLSQSIELGFTGTEELVTKYIGNWRAHGAQEEDNKVIMRYNVKKYGTHEDTVDFYAFNYISAIVKTLTFWIIRKGHTWKKLKFQAALDALNVETFDGVTLDFQGNYASNGPVLGYVEEGTYNTDTNTMDFSVWTGVRAGDMEQFDLAYPQDVSTDLKFPDPIAEAAGFSGGDGPGNTASGTIGRIGQSVGSDGGSSGGPLKGASVIEFPDPDPYKDGTRQRQDRGSNKPSDVGDGNPGKPIITSTGQVELGTSPPDSPKLIDNQFDQEPIVIIDIRSTLITDANNLDTVTTLDSFFEEVTDQKLKARTDATWKKTDGDEGEFDFKFDDDSGKFGAGTAFLNDD